MGTLVSLVGYVAAASMFMQGLLWQDANQADQIVGFLAYLGSCALIVWFGEALRRTTSKVQESELAARDHAQRLQVTIHSIGDAVVSTDSRGRVTLLNPVAEALTGWSSEEARGRPLTEVFDIVNETTREPVENPVDKVLETGRIVGLANHTVLRSRDGREWPIDDSAAPILDSNGAISGVILVFHDVSERREAERAAIKSNRELEDFFDTAAIGLHWVGPDGTILRANSSDYGQLGYTEQEYVGRNVEEFYVDPAVFREIQEKLHRGDRVQERPVRLRCKNGSTLHALIDASALFEDGKLVHTRAFVRNVTRHISTENALSQSEERLHLALEAGGMGNWEFTVGSSHVVWSPGLEALHGLEPGTFPGTFEAFLVDIHPDDRARVIAEIQHAIAEKMDHFVEYRIIRPDGHVRWVEGRGKVFRDEAGQAIRLVGVCTDVTQRKQAEFELEERARAHEAMFVLADRLQRSNTLEDIYSSALDAITSALKCNRASILLFDEQASMRFVAWKGLSDAYRSRTNGHSPWTPDELDPKPIAFADVETAGFEDWLHDIVTKEGIQAMAFIPLTLDGKLIGKFMAYFDEPYEMSEDEVEISLTIARQLSAGVGRARALQSLRDNDRRKDEFLATLAHELRGPLAPIRNSLEILNRSNEGDSVQAFARETMDRQVHHMVRLIEDLLDLSRISRDQLQLRLEVVDIRPALEQALEACRPVVESSQHSLTLDCPDSPILLDADPVRLVQIFSNLVNNACKYSEPGGQITVRVRVEGRKVTTEVCDKGIGIEPDKLDSIFEMFSQVEGAKDRSQGGLGIGLTLTKRLVEMHSGKITAQSDGLGKGSCFTVTLPVSERHPQIQDYSLPTLKPDSAPIRILIVDDNIDAATSLGLLLEADGHTTAVYHDGESALDAAGSFRPDAAVLDIGLPKLNGYQVASMIRQEPWGKDIKLIALTGWGQEEDRALSASAGFDEHMVKPPDLQKLRTTLSTLRSNQTTV